MTTGTQLKIRGLARVSSHNQEFLKKMRDIAREYCTTYGQVSADDLRAYADKWGLYPDHPNAYGGIFREPGWVVVGHRQSAHPSTHAREIKVWAWRGA